MNRESAKPIVIYQKKEDKLEDGVSDGKSLSQPACRRRWKKCKEGNR
jgi:hypothetical protein